MSLPDDEDFLMAPVLKGLCRLESLTDGTLNLEDIAWANEALMLQAENERRAQAHAEAQARNR